MPIRIILHFFIILSTPGVIAAFFVYFIFIPQKMFTDFTLNDFFYAFTHIYIVGFAGWFSLIKLLFMTKDNIKKSNLIKILTTTGVLSNLYFIITINRQNPDSEFNVIFNIAINYIVGSPVIFTIALISVRLLQKPTSAAGPTQTAAVPAADHRGTPPSA